MNEKKRLEFQQKIISRQLTQIDELKEQVQSLRFEIEKKNKIINSVESMREELTRNVDEIKEYKKQYVALINELKKMKEIINQDVYKGKWWLVKFFIK